MPLALDLISTLVMGSILPVATTLTTAAAIELQIMIRLRRFFLPLPLPSTTASCLIPNIRTVIHLLLRQKRGNSSSKYWWRDGACPVSLAASYQGIALGIPQILRNPIPFRGWPSAADF